jgi:thiamine pyrophosphate-dependent acetolactate synthase large subunit-like protein
MRMAIVVGGEAAVWMAAGWLANRPGQLHLLGVTGTIGTGSALAVGAWAANRKPVLRYTGDGSFGFYPMEIVPAIKRAAANGKPSIINVQVNEISMSPMVAGPRAMARADK